ncbi:hypothetical protein R3P38DRAFT_3214303 [Favolaschia claudopus]|uniref:Protein kinase domain-containing protein n=1 Tax=Favolaschia claudopus TaxID=2862362 RepID=A0AAW0AC24_9AGAR
MSCDSKFDASETLNPDGHRIMITGGIGGRGGRSRMKGGTGGLGEGPQVHISGSVRTIHVNGKNTRYREFFGTLDFLGSFQYVLSTLSSAGDVDLQSEVYKNYANVSYRNGQCFSRTIYSAKIDKKKGAMTVAVYKGKSAEEEWNKDLAEYESFRHPNIVQLYGIISSKLMRAIIFHDELVPLKVFLDGYRYSSTLMCYIHAYVCGELYDLQEYFHSAFGYPLSYARSERLIRVSTGHICIDPMGYGDDYDWFRKSEIQRMTPMDVLSSATSTRIVGRLLTFAYYHDMCDLYLCNSRSFAVSSTTAIGLGTVKYVAPSDEDSGNAVEIASCLSTMAIHDDIGRRGIAWRTYRDGNPILGYITETGWTR